MEFGMYFSDSIVRPPTPSEFGIRVGLGSIALIGSITLIATYRRQQTSTSSQKFMPAVMQAIAAVARLTRWRKFPGRRTSLP